MSPGPRLRRVGRVGSQATNRCRSASGPPRLPLPNVHGIISRAGERLDGSGTRALVACAHRLPQEPERNQRARGRLQCVSRSGRVHDWAVAQSGALLKAIRIHRCELDASFALAWMRRAVVVYGGDLAAEGADRGETCSSRGPWTVGHVTGRQLHLVSSRQCRSQRPQTAAFPLDGSRRCGRQSAPGHESMKQQRLRAWSLARQTAAGYSTRANGLLAHHLARRRQRVDMTRLLTHGCTRPSLKGGCGFMCCVSARSQPPLYV